MFYPHVKTWGIFYHFFQFQYIIKEMKSVQLVKWLSKNGYVRSPRIKDAFTHIQREDFVQKEEGEDVHKNLPIALGFGRTIPHPSTVAFLLELVEPKFGEKILHVGAGTGWQTALLAYVVGGKSDSETLSGKVIALENVETFSNVATKNLEHYNFVSNGVVDVVNGNAKEGYPKDAPYDKIVSSVAMKEVPPIWKEEVRIGGRIVVPIGERIVVLDKTGADTFSRRQYFGFEFSPIE